MRSSVYDKQKTGSTHGLLQMQNMSNLNNNLKVLNNSQSNWKKKHIGGGQPTGAPVASIAQADENGWAPADVSNSNPGDPNEYKVQVQANEYFHNLNNDSNKIKNINMNIDVMNSKKTNNKTNFSRSTSNQHSF